MAVDPSGPKPLIASEIAMQLKLLHMAIAGVTRNPIMALNDDECNALANSICEVGKHFDLFSWISGPIPAVMGLVGTAGMIYVPRVAMIRAAKKKPDRQAAQPADTGDIFTQPAGGIDFSADIMQ